MLIPMPPKGEYPEPVKSLHKRYGCPDENGCGRSACTENYCALRDSMDLQKEFEAYITSCNPTERDREMRREAQRQEWPQGKPAYKPEE